MPISKMNHRRTTPLLLVVAALLLSSWGCSSEKGQPVTPVGAAQPVTIVGENYCLGCALKKEQGAAAQCSVYGHRHALKVESATGPGGSALPELQGATVHYLENDASASLVKGDELHGKKVEIKGKLFAREKTLEVHEVRGL
ncbi:MAG: hypothetical protein HY698_21455 [Deltaproteobacteria bacterium]|nr:hypothetical protein [Deltaproteobacteria bacterium]